MSLLFRGTTPPPRIGNMFPSRTRKQVGSVTVTDKTALQHSAVWAALRLRADLISSMPADAYRKVQGIDVEVPSPPVLLNPGGDEWDLGTWLWASQFDLDRVGNCFGVITEVDGSGRPKVIQLQEHTQVAVKVARDGTVSYRINGKPYKASEIWHERQYRLPGQVMGLSALSLAAYSIGQYLSAQQFGIEWFANGGAVPSGVLRNKDKVVPDDAADVIKERFKVAIADRDVFVTGNDWEYSTLNVSTNEAQFLASQEYSSTDIGRFIGVPGDLIDLSVKGQNVTYANISQRNLQFLIMNLWPAVRRRQVSLSRLLPAPRYVRFNTDALLQMDPETKSRVLGQQIRDRMRTSTEVRRVDNFEPFTDVDYAEFDRLFPKNQAPQKSTTIGD
jgi:HK97 family phage portal protein